MKLNNNKKEEKNRLGKVALRRFWNPQYSIGINIAGLIRQNFTISITVCQCNLLQCIVNNLLFICVYECVHCCVHAVLCSYGHLQLQLIKYKQNFHFTAG